MIQGYATPSSASAGQKVTFHVAAFDDNDRKKPGQTTKFRAYFFRRGANPNWQYQGASDVWTANPAPPVRDATGDWKWPGFDFTVPKGWPSGAYVAVFVKDDGTSGRPDPDDPTYNYYRTLFVITVAPEDPGTGATILYKLPLFTYCAYNYEGSVSLYAVKGNSNPAQPVKATLRRPGCGLGGDPWDLTDLYDSSSWRQTFSHWDAPFISWLESNGYKVDYSTDLDIHKNENGFLQNYSLLLSVGHDEYWSRQMRSNVDDFIKNGGNVAFFSGNTCWWCVEVQDDNNDTALTCNKANESALWQNVKPSETMLTGVSYQYGGGWWDDNAKRDSVGFTVQKPDHWVFQGTRLARGVSFGDRDGEGLVGYECDGAGIRKDAGGNYVLSNTSNNPATFQILGVGVLSSNWGDATTAGTLNRERRSGDGAATMGIWGGDGSNGTVFTAATTDWARVLALGTETPSRHYLDRITKNVLNRLNVTPAADSLRVSESLALVSGD